MRFLLTSLFLMLLLVSSVTFTNFASGYEKENHYWLKVALALNCGFTLDEARLISIGDFVIDEDWNTQPVLPGGGESSSKWKWHALPTENPDVDKNTMSNGNHQIKKRQKELYDRALNEKDVPMKLFKFGEYLHYEEDKWSHWGYTTGIGHAVPNLAPGVDSPDATHANPDVYRYMVFDSMVNLGKLAKSLGKDTECVTDLLPIDTYHTTPEFGKDFPWFSLNELKRYSETEKFQKQVNKQLEEWGKAKLINDAMTASKNDGAKGVTTTFINYISEKTGISKSDIEKKYDYNDDDLDIDDDGNTKKLPENLVKSLTNIIKEKKSDPKKKTSSTVSVDKATLNYFKGVFEDSKWNEANAASLANLNVAEKKLLGQLASDPKISKKTGNTKSVELLLKTQDSDEQKINRFVTLAKKSSLQIKTIAQKQGVMPSDLDKIEKSVQTKVGKPLKITKIDNLKEGLSQIKEQDKNAISDSGKNPLAALARSGVGSSDVSSALRDFSNTPYGAILNQNDLNPQLTTEDEVMSLLLKLTEQLDKQIADKTKEMNSMNQPSTTSPSRDQNEDLKMTQLRQLVEKRSQIFDILRQVVDRYEETQVRAISSLRDGGPSTDAKTEVNTQTKIGTTTEPKIESTNTKPSLTMPKQVTQEATSSSGASVNYGVSGQDKEDGSIVPTCDHPPGSTFPIGTTTVTCTAKDSSNNSISGSFTVTVRDTAPPIIDQIQPTEGARDDTGVVIYFIATAHDVVDGSITPSCNYASGYKFPIGTTILTCTADDSRGNHASRSLQITVTIKESGQ